MASSGTDAALASGNITVAIAMWHQRLGMGLARLVISGLRGFAARYPGPQGFTWATACSGSDIVLRVLGHLTDYWRAHYNIDIVVSSKFACEIDPAKQAFLQQQHGATLMFEDVGDLHKFKAKNVVTGQMAVVPLANAFGFGGS